MPHVINKQLRCCSVKGSIFSYDGVSQLLLAGLFLYQEAVVVVRIGCLPAASKTQINELLTANIVQTCLHRKFLSGKQ